MRRQRFRILLLDDNSLVCERASRWIGRHPWISKEDVEFNIELTCVQVKLTPRAASPGSEAHCWDFDQETLTELSRACARRPHLILADFGFIDDTVAQTLKDQTKGPTKRPITATELAGKVLTLRDLYDKVCSASTSDHSPEVCRTIRKNLFESGAPVYLYTYTSEAFSQAVGTPHGRWANTREAFPRSRVIAIDTRLEFYNNEEFDWPSPRVREPGFHAHLTTVLLDHVVLLQLEHTRLQAARYLRLRRTAKTAAVLTAIGAAVGFGSQWLGGMVLAFAEKGEVTEGIIVSLACLVFLLLFGMLAAKLYEWSMNQLLADESKDP